MEDHVHPARCDPSRRQFLSFGVLAASAATGTVVAPELTWAASAATSASAASAGEPSRRPSTLRWTARTSQNGWPLVSSDAVHRGQIEGSDARTSLLPGAASVVLLHVARRYHYEVESLGQDHVIGHRVDRNLRARYESNLLSGTAISLNPGLHPIGATGTLFPLQVTVLRDILTDCEGVVRWGGDDTDLPAEGFFQLDVPPRDATLARVAARMSGWRLLRGQGAGAPVDPFDAGRRSRAQHLQKLQMSRVSG
jgi:hypothetical protein